MSKPTPFSVGRRWFCERKGETSGRARVYFVIVGPGENSHGKPSKTHKLCRLETHPDDLAAKLPGSSHNEITSTYSHAHIKKHAVLVPLEDK